MKKILLSFLLTLSFTVNAQILLVEDWSSHDIGGFGYFQWGDQGGWSTMVYPDIVPTNPFNIINIDGSFGKALQVAGPSISDPSIESQYRHVYNDGIREAWSARGQNNNIIEVTYDFFTGPVTSSKNNHRLSIGDTTLSKVLCGMVISMDTKILSAITYFDATPWNGTITNYLFNLGNNDTPLVLLPNTWYKLGFSYQWGGVVKFKVKQGNTLLSEIYIQSAAYSSNVGRLSIDSYNNQGITNNVSSVGVYDNITATATSTDTLLDIESNEIEPFNYVVFPNPATNRITVSSKSNAINLIELSDSNGRIVKRVKGENETEIPINISDISAGVYILRIVSEEGKATKRIIKK